MRVTGKRLFVLCSALTLSAAAVAAGPAKSPEASQRYQQERAACQARATAEDRKTCLREAGAALIEARQGKLSEGENFEQNKIARCLTHTNEDREYCVRRMTGEGTVSGSVEGGGILRELIVTVPADEPAAPRTN